MEGVAKDRRGQDRKLWTDCRAHRQSHLDTRGGSGLRRQHDRRGHSMPSRHSYRWAALRIPVGRAAQASLAGAGTTVVIDDRVAALDWSALQGELNDHGVARAAGVLRAQECREIAGLYELEEGFRSRVIMGRHGFGRGEYRYFSYPLPVIVQNLRASLYSRLADIANCWHAQMDLDTRFPH